MPGINKLVFSRSVSHGKTSRVPEARWQESGDAGSVPSHPEYLGWYRLLFQKRSKGAAAYCRQLAARFVSSTLSRALAQALVA